MPAAARVQTEAGAKAFAQFYIDVSGQAWVDADPTLLDGLSTAACQTCANLRGTAATLRSSKQHYSSTPIKVTSLKKFSATTVRVVFDARLEELPVQVLGAGGGVVKTVERRAITRGIAVVWQGDTWLVDGISE